MRSLDNATQVSMDFRHKWPMQIDNYTQASQGKTRLLRRSKANTKIKVKGLGTMIYGVGYVHFVEGERRAVIKSHITKEEYEKYKSGMMDISQYTKMKQIYSLVERNGREFLSFSALLKQNKGEIDGLSSREIHLEANRLLINYLTAYGMFIDYGEKNIKKALGQKSMDEFRSRGSHFYDTHVSYRFISLLRNFIVHYEFPLTELLSNLEGTSGIYAKKEHLLQFSRWKHAKPDIEKMADRIAIEPHVHIMTLFVRDLFQYYIYSIAPNLVKVIEYVNNLIKLSDGKQPAFFTFRNIDDLKDGKININPIDVSIYIEALDELKTHPSIELNIEEDSPREERGKGWHIELYLDKEQIFAGPSSQLVEKYGWSGVLNIGDQVSVNEQTRRVVEIIVEQLKKDGSPDTIKYFLK